MTIARTSPGPTYSPPANALHANQAAPSPNAAQLLSQNPEKLKQSAADAFAKFDRSIDDINAAIKGQPNTVTSRFRQKRPYFIGSKVFYLKGAVSTRPMTLSLAQFTDNPRAGEKESRCNNSLRSVIAVLANIENRTYAKRILTEGFLSC